MKLDLLFVMPDFQRQGIARNMVAAAANQLYRQGVTEVFSAYHALNEDSRHWHHAFGFEDVYDQHYMRMKYQWHRHEIQRQKRLGMSENLEALEKEREYWHGLLEEQWRF